MFTQTVLKVQPPRSPDLSLYIFIYWDTQNPYCIQLVSSPPRNDAAVRDTMCTQTVLEVQPPRSPDLSLYIFIYWDTQNPYCIQLQLKIKRPFTDALFMSVKPFAIAPRPLRMCDCS